MARKPARVQVRVQPRSTADEVVGERDGRLVVRVTAPPTDGKANAAVCALIARRAAVPKSRVRVVRGSTGRDKVVEVDGVDDETIRCALKGRR